MPSRPRLVLVHGSVTGGAMTWGAQVRELGDRFRLLVVERPGFPPNPPVERVDFDVDAVLIADLLEPGDHLVGHSYGGVIAMLATAVRPDQVASLTVIEPPCTQVALDVPAVAAFAAGGLAVYSRATVDDPETFLRTFLTAIGSTYMPPSPLPPALERGAELLAVERGPWEAVIPLAELRAAGIPTLAVSGGHHEAFEAICDRLGTERAILPGFGHAPHRHPEFNPLLADFVTRS